MRRLFCVLVLFTVTFFSYGQKLDSTQFKKLFDGVTEVYDQIIDPYLVDLAKSELPPLAENANKEAKQIYLAGVETKLYLYRKNVDWFFMESYTRISKDLNIIGEYPKIYLCGYFDQGLQNKFPQIDSKFYIKVREEINKM